MGRDQHAHLPQDDAAAQGHWGAWRGVTTRLLFTYHTYKLARLPFLTHPPTPPTTPNPATPPQAPTVEVFFAKQGGKTGIQPHSDGCNFVLTAVRACVPCCPAVPA